MANGVQTIQAIHKWQKSSKIKLIPIIAPTAHINEYGKVKNKSGGMVAVSTKPLDQKDM